MTTTMRKSHDTIGDTILDALQLTMDMQGLSGHHVALISTRRQVLNGTFIFNDATMGYKIGYYLKTGYVRRFNMGPWGKEQMWIVNWRHRVGLRGWHGNHNRIYTGRKKLFKNDVVGAQARLWEVYYKAVAKYQRWNNG